ncbi:MAG: ABC transporter ATP-binding protein [Ardenticatenia bacterium]|nr:MAG: ABC transporter ATP-binding protein [Ardenticatenia bacterium]
MERTVIQVEAITFAYPNGTCIFEDFSWQVARGEAWAVVGPSGCGKTTLLHLLAGLVRPQAGCIRIDGQVLRRPRPRTGLILQDYGLLPWATLRANVALGLDIRAFYGPDGVHAPRDEVLDDKEERVRYWMTRLGIHHLAGHYPHQVSGGQRQRAAIARTLALRPDILLMDEPFGALDALTRQDLMQLTMQLRREEGLTTVIVTHSIEEALYLGEYVLVLTQPPHRVATVVPNPHVGDAACRHDRAFLALCHQLRALMGEGACEMA